MKHKTIKQIVKNENGQSMVLVVLLMVVIMGFAALVVDLGMVSYTKTRLQNAADAAALAGARDLPDATTAESTAIIYAGKNGVHNGVQKTVVTVTYPDNGDANKIKVECTKTVSYTFARVLGFTEKDVSASAVAQKRPKALPFINLDDDYNTVPGIVAWEKIGTGDFESLLPSEYHMVNLGADEDHSKGYFTIDYSDGITIKKGYVATIKQEVGYIYEQHKPQYIFSLSSDVINSGKYASGLMNGDIIPLADLVLLQVTFDSCDNNGLHLTRIKVYDINNGVFPSEGTSSLVE